MKKAASKKEQYWREILRRFEESGLSAAEFCRREKLNQNSFSYWKREISRRDAARSRGKNVREQDKDERISYWRTMIARFNMSGLSKDDFCAKEKINPSAFVWWRGELKRRDTAKAQAVARPLDVFLPVTVAAQQESQPKLREQQTIAEIDIVSGNVRIFDTAGTNGLIALLKAFRESMR